MNAPLPGTPASPCISVCLMDELLDSAPGGLCAGCLRTLDEIANWASASDGYKHAVLAHIVLRRARIGEPK